MKSLLHSRKFWLAVSDMIVTLVILWSHELLPAVRVEVFVATVIAIQAPFVVLINGIAKEDAAAIAAGIHPRQRDS